MKAEKQENKVSSEEQLSILSRSLLTGFIGGILWSSISSLMYYFNFSEVAPKYFILRSWLDAPWTDRWLGVIISILLAGLLSIGAAFIYYGLFRKINSMWMGLLYGVILWVIIFIVMQPIFPNIPSFNDLSYNTLISTLCLYVLYGTFIGYSISYDYHDMKIREIKKKEG
ncbi:YqhR family membrane protein [Oceanobacillus saliphilus]|uniref:YqhR family membrane protein n=1 Tax=Oceanobacillus saliphilus TaxID=2925834 RepID=UPI00201E6EB5|nr:YqhR family membrane protein [Oceanobacillus saliphilus]